MKKKNIIIRMQPYVELRREDINDRAFRLWRAAGRPPGRALSYWLQAEVELLSEHMDGNSDPDTLAEAA